MIAAVVATFAWSAVAAIVLAALAIAAFVLFFEAANRKPHDALVRWVFASGRHLRGWLAFAGTSTAAWARAARKLLRLRRESRSLRREREPTLRSLGDAAYREDESLVRALQERIREIDEELAKREAARAEALAAARRHVDEEREAAQSTRRLTVDDIASTETDER
jgi:hypothetical protein